MSIPELVPVYDMNVFDKTANDMAFVLDKLQADGTLYEPRQYRDLTGKAVVLIMTGIFRDEFVLSSADGANTLGSVLTVNVDPTTGQFQWHLDQDDMARIIRKTGYYRIVERLAGSDDIILLRGTVNVITFNEEQKL